MLIVTATDTTVTPNATYSATFDGTHKVRIHEGPTLAAYENAGIKNVTITIGDYNSIPNAT